VADENRRLLKVKATLTEELLRWRQEAQNDLPALLASVRRATEAEENAANLEAELAMAQRRAEEHLAQLLAYEMTRDKRQAEFAALEAALIVKLRDAEQGLFRQYDAWLEREAILRRRDQDWRIEAQTRNDSVENLRAEITVQRDELRRVIGDYREKAAALGRDAGAAAPNEDIQGIKGTP
jgi:hypothetical protein